MTGLNYLVLFCKANTFHCRERCFFEGYLAGEGNKKEAEFAASFV